MARRRALLIDRETGRSDGLISWHLSCYNGFRLIGNTFSKTKVLLYFNLDVAQFQDISYSFSAHVPLYRH